MDSRGKNILLITTDEQHRETISAAGARTHRTEAIDRLWREGTVFTEAYTSSPVCLPSRCCWMTGMEPHHSGSLSNEYGASLSLRYANLFTCLKKQGYATSLHGKCHFIPVPYRATRPGETLEYEPFLAYYRALGMDELDVQDGNHVSLWFYDDYAKDISRIGLLGPYRKEAHGKPENQGVFPFPGPAAWHPDAWTGRKTVERILRSRKDAKNFVWCSFSGPHYPVDTPQAYVDAVDMSRDPGRRFLPGEWDDAGKYHRSGYYGPGTTEGSGQAGPSHAQKDYSEAYWTKWRRAYFGNVLLIDEWIGKIVEAARRQWGSDFTVIFTSDHGEMMGNHSLWGKNGALFEDVLRVPLIIWSPGQKHRTVTQRVASKDLFPTILSLAGAPIPGQCDGRPLGDVVRSGGRNIVFSACEGRFALLFGHLKLEWNRYAPTGKVFREFYDLEKDPYEFTNRYTDAAYRREIEEMEAWIQKREEKEKLLSSLFFTPGGNRPFYLDDGSGPGCGSQAGTDY